MKKGLCIRIIIMSFIFILLSNIILSSPVYAQDPLRKLGRGVTNMALCWWELPTHIQSAGKEAGVAAALSYGILKGLGRTVLRMASGIYETVTFLVPIPKNYKPILTNPEFIFGKEVQ